MRKNPGKPAQAQDKANAKYADAYSSPIRCGTAASEAYINMEMQNKYARTPNDNKYLSAMQKTHKNRKWRTLHQLL
jgi:hypothetical protein